ncbi:DUF1254 domain-containing protein [Kaistia dalseonensis]|uniref:DUF1254 domain-containing protein n=1 Tax=Kaistia dalseonensis TaxID=410840 RepID=A0ABU0H433_9HYPH|nr:DUF1254 domain-containing protein [Kaistia dalseonensis]MCX5494481.1 DUF1254 domain-containing protein [Kaistia dalseonensis]MDQ0437060.1 hypothetical protein [Kaistia dalseonensis]
MKMLGGRWAALGALALMGSVMVAHAEPKYSADVPEKITTPESVDTRIGTLKFKNGAPDAATSSLVYDNLDHMRGVQAFLRGMSATSVRALCNGLESVGVKANRTFGITEDLMDARSLFLTPNTTTVYVFTCLDLSDGPIVMEVPTGVLGPVDDADFRWVTDIGLTGPDAGKGGQYLFVPPGYKDALPTEGYFQAKPSTNTLLVFFRAFVKNGDIAGAVQHVKTGAKLYPLHATTENGEPPETEWVNTSGLKFNTISANDFSFYDELNQVVQKEPADFVDPDVVGLYASIGIRKGQPFAPDERMKKILTDAVAVGNATARTIVFDSRDPGTKFYPDRAWMTPFVGGSYQFLDGAARLLNARTMFFYFATGITPAMSMAKVGSGSAYAGAVKDSNGAYLDGGKTYKVTLPGPIPAKDFWSFVVYDNETRSLLETDQKFAGVDSNDPKLKLAADGSATVWFGPKAPEGQESNWVQTTPGKGWNVLLRLYGPLEPWFDKSWKPGDIELVK